MIRKLLACPNGASQSSHEEPRGHVVDVDVAAAEIAHQSLAQLQPTCLVRGRRRNCARRVGGKMRTRNRTEPGGYV